MVEYPYDIKGILLFFCRISLGKTRGERLCI